MNGMKKACACTMGRIALACLISAGVLLICSKNSPLYPMNDWVDVNCFFTVGRGMRHGLTPYLDLYEQKGPLLYAVFALAAWISETSFLGVFLIEAACFAAFLYFSGRTAEVLSGNSFAYGLTAAGLGIGIPLSPAFSHGGSAEELFLPVFAVSLYIVLKAMHERRPLTAWQTVLLGACAAAALWTKYTFCGLYAGLGIAVLVWDCADCRGRNLIRMAACALAGAALLTAAVLARYALAGALPALWQVYFVDNLTQYSQNIRGGIYPMPLPNLLNNLTWSIPSALGLIWLLALACLVWGAFRSLSRNIRGRQRENEAFLGLTRNFTGTFRGMRDRFAQRKEYRFFRCPSCRTWLRVPRGRGKLNITCRQCGERFTRST